VAVTVVGLEANLTPEFLFSAIYDIIPPLHAWRVPNSLVEFFVPATYEGSGQVSRNALFYHRDQFVPNGFHLSGLSVNYHGNLALTSDRASIDLYRTPPKDKIAYREEMSKSADEGLRTIPELAIALARDILSDSHSDGMAYLVAPRDKTGANAYKIAFEAAMRELYKIPTAPIYPTTTENAPLCRELGYTPLKVPRRALEIMQESGAYLDIRQHARQTLLSSPPVPDAPGIERLRTAISILAPIVSPENVTIRDYKRSAPSVVWDREKQLFAFAFPPQCDDDSDHPGKPCLCWVGPVLLDAARLYAVGSLQAKELFRGYLLCMSDPTAEATVAGPEPMNDDMDVGELLKHCCPALFRLLRQNPCSKNPNMV
jgi:hypothetical protein